jgi:hypothetical protein
VNLEHHGQVRAKQQDNNTAKTRTLCTHTRGQTCSYCTPDHCLPPEAPQAQSLQKHAHKHTVHDHTRTNANTNTRTHTRMHETRGRRTVAQEAAEQKSVARTIKDRCMHVDGRHSNEHRTSKACSDEASELTTPTQPLPNTSTCPPPTHTPCNPLSLHNSSPKALRARGNLRHSTSTSDMAVASGDGSAAVSALVSTVKMLSRSPAAGCTSHTIGSINTQPAKHPICTASKASVP